MLTCTIPPNEILREALVNGIVRHPDGRSIDVVANISEVNSTALYATVRRFAPKMVVEIGMAYGVSTLSILTALQENNSGRLISIDPYFGWPSGRVIALHQIDRAGFSHLHEHIQQPSYLALPALLQAERYADLIYVDGNHDFEYVFADMFLADKLLSVGGVLGFNDAGWRAVFKVIRFLKSHLRYEELDVGLPRVYRSRNPLFSLIRRLEGRSSNDRYFRKGH